MVLKYIQSGNMNTFNLSQLPRDGRIRRASIYRLHPRRDELALGGVHWPFAGRHHWLRDASQPTGVQPKSAAARVAGGRRVLEEAPGYHPHPRDPRETGDGKFNGRFVRM